MLGFRRPRLRLTRINQKLVVIILGFSVPNQICNRLIGHADQLNVSHSAGSQPGGRCDLPHNCRRHYRVMMLPACSLRRSVLLTFSSSRLLCIVRWRERVGFRSVARRKDRLQHQVSGGKRGSPDGAVRGGKTWSLGRSLSSRFLVEVQCS